MQAILGNYGASEFVLRIICEGYLLPLVQLPRAKTVKNHSSAQCQLDFVTDSIRDLIERGCIKEVKSEEAVICSPLGVVNNGKKLRLILDWRYVNTYLAKFNFRMEDLKTIARVYEKGDYVITFDLKSGYHHIEIAQEHQKYLGFKWFNAEGTITTYVFCVLPFGLSTAPYVLTKVTRVLLRRWRELGIRCQLYMDDGSGGHSTVEGAKVVAKQMKADLLRAGFVPNEQKSQWEPSQTVKMLGMRIDLKVGRIFATERRVARLKECLARLSGLAAPPAREVARLAGFLLSMSLALGPICRLRTRAFYSMILSRSSWYAPVKWPNVARCDLEFWSTVFEDWHGQPCWKNCPKATVLTWSDPSDSGWGGFLVEGSTVEVAKGEWSNEILNDRRSSTWRELRAIALVLESLAHRLEGGICIHRSDNQAAVHIIQVGSRREHLQREAMPILQVCMKHGVRLIAEWVPREQNELADYC